MADGYAGGRLEWHHFDRVDAPPTAAPSAVVPRRAELLPVPLRYHGMPAARFWAFEAGDVSFAAIDAGPEDLARVAVAGYATVYGVDWYLVPLQVPAATLTTVTSLRVHDDFGASRRSPQRRSSTAAARAGPSASSSSAAIRGPAPASRRRSSCRRRSRRPMPPAPRGRAVHP